MSVDSSRLAPGVVRVIHADTADVLVDEAARSRALALLEPAERVRHDRYRLDADRDMFLVGRALARVLVGRALGVDPSAWRWQDGPHGRPGIAAPETRLHFNLAHSAGLVVCALGEMPAIGVDVEDLDRRTIDRGLVQRYCAPAEAADVEAQGDAWQQRFLVYWTLKEAYLKARGLGIALPLSSISFSLRDGAPAVAFLGRLADLDTRWAFDLVQVTDRHLVAAAAPMLDRRPTFSVERLQTLW